MSSPPRKTLKLKAAAPARDPRRRPVRPGAAPPPHAGGGTGQGHGGGQGGPGGGKSKGAGTGPRSGKGAGLGAGPSEARKGAADRPRRAGGPFGGAGEGAPKAGAKKPPFGAPKASRAEPGAKPARGAGSRSAGHAATSGERPPRGANIQPAGRDATFGARSARGASSQPAGRDATSGARPARGASSQPAGRDATSGARPARGPAAPPARAPGSPPSRPASTPPARATGPTSRDAPRPAPQRGPASPARHGPASAPPRARPAAPAAAAPAPAAQGERSAEGIRLSKHLADQGLASRREADEWIEAGWVRVDGKLAVLGQRVLPHQQVEIDPAAHHAQAQRMTILLNKPIGYVSGQAEDGYEPAAVLVTPQNHWSGDGSRIAFHPGHLRGLAPAGRLDIDSTGLLVLTQDGRIAKLLIGEDSRVEKEYLVRVEPMADGSVKPDALALLNHGLWLDDQPLKPAKVSWQNEQQLRFVLREGRKRQIRRMCELVGYKVTALRRVRIGSIALGALPPGQWRYLGPHEKFI